MRKIVLHSAAADTLGGYHDAGAKLCVSAQKKAGHITAARADQLLAESAAVTLAEAAAEEQAAEEQEAEQQEAEETAEETPAPIDAV